MQRVFPLIAGVVIVMGAWPEAHAAPTERFREGGYVVFHPGLFGIPLEDDEADSDDNIGDALDVSYEWGLGAGYLLTPSDRFYVGLGFALQHMVANIEDDGFSSVLASVDWDGHVLRLLPELRIGGGHPRVFPYLRLAPGLALAMTNWHGSVLGVSNSGDDTDAGFNLGVGAGAQGIVWRGLSVGAEIGADLAFFGEEEDGGDDINFSSDGSWQLHTFYIRLMLGWYFG